MSRSSFYVLIALMIELLSCGNNHLIEDKTYRQIVLGDYQSRKDRYGHVRNELFDGVDSLTDVAGLEAAKYLVAYMPLNDIADYSFDLLSANVNAALRTRREMPWGPSVPDDIFLHFVLPQRVNTENLDSFRIAFYDELADRVEGLSAEEAALEVNHWCHEKVSYQPSDSRTSAPMATILSSRGRCGEESTLTVSALRTIGMPARQVYTPRWAHSDDNHAWVEVWINGSWYYMGACEPEPVLDKGWFTEPARRAMLIHTKAFGKYDGDELQVKKREFYSELNVLDKYADVKRLKVIVTGEDEKAIPLADVDFLLYNYAELYPIASLKADETGRCTLTTGRGSLIVWARNEGRYGFAEAGPEDDSVVIKLQERIPSDIYRFDFMAPPALTPKPGPSDEMITRNNERLKEEDSIRQSYIDSWLKDINIAEVALSSGTDRARLEKTLKSAMGNYKDILAFIEGAGDKSDLALRLLENISEKDLRDTRHEVLSDHLNNVPEMPVEMESEFYDPYILSPRVDNEILTPFRSDLKEAIPGNILESFKDPYDISAWVDRSVAVNLTDNYYGTPITPLGVFDLGESDPHSRDIFFVALCRTMGYPARLETGTGRPQYHDGSKWVDVWFKDAVRPSQEKGFVTFVSEETSPTPEYHIHFTLSVLVDGRYKALDFGYNVRINDLPAEIPLDPGKYMLLTGNRDENGNVLAETRFFDLLPGDHKNLEINIRKKEVLAGTGMTIDLNREIKSFDDKTIQVSSISGKGLVICWLDPDKEPTIHLLRDLAQYKKEFDEWGGWFLFLLDKSAVTESFSASEITGLPDNKYFAWDNNSSFLGTITQNEISKTWFPVVVCSDSKGEVLFFSEGYKIGTGEQIIKNIK